ncbi:hypothetical protein [Brevibacterium marinum]|uniref:PknH-like extracellular domain-containing protein n=1 Tax=Brevibacterium marinum TaxID=418643 RepID=A0A846S8D0_9MICO|nr:hypothetical protein [Brevibacterium marinum]NJC58301.1 hypothetical protein [Brevibacterium marinum]
MKRAFPAIALIAGLSLTGCTGNDSQDDGAEEDSTAQPASDEAPEATVLDEDQLTEVIESTEVDGQSYTTFDMSAASGSDAVKVLQTSEFEPAECKDLSMAALNVAQQSKGNTVGGISSDKTLSVALTSFSDVADAGSQLKSSSTVTEVCNDVTVRSQGIEMKMSYETFDAEVPSADETVGVRAEISAGGQTVLNADTVTGRIGNNIVTAANVADTDDETTVPQTAEAFVEAVKTAG